MTSVWMNQADRAAPPRKISDMIHAEYGTLRNLIFDRVFSLMSKSSILVSIAHYVTPGSLTIHLLELVKFLIGEAPPWTPRLILPLGVDDRT